LPEAPTVTRTQSANGPFMVLLCKVKSCTPADPRHCISEEARQYDYMTEDHKKQVKQKAISALQSHCEKDQAHKTALKVYKLTKHSAKLTWSIPP
jgi:hypothetical protein